MINEIVLKRGTWMGTAEVRDLLLLSMFQNLKHFCYLHVLLFYKKQGTDKYMGIQIGGKFKETYLWRTKRNQECID